jgi:hypothetical protein
VAGGDGADLAAGHSPGFEAGELAPRERLPVPPLMGSRVGAAARALQGGGWLTAVCYHHRTSPALWGVRGQDHDRERAAGPRLEPGEVRCARGDLRPQLVPLGAAGQVRVNVVLPPADPYAART